MKQLSILVLLLMTATASIAAPESRGVLVDKIVAVVNNDVILASELDDEVDSFRKMARERNVQLPPEDLFRQQVLERMIAERLQLQYADRAGITIPDDRLNQMVTNIAEQNKVSIEDLPRLMAAEGMQFAEFRENLRKDLILKTLREQVIEREVTVSPREIEEYLEQQKKTGQAEYRLAHILISLPGEASPYEAEAARQKIEDLRRQIVDEGKAFSEMAASYSDGQQALEGGDLGWRKGGELPSLFADVARNMEVGSVSEVIKSGSGFHLIKLVDARRPERVLATETHSRHILLKPSKVLTREAAIEKLRALKKRIEAGEDFAELAKEYSEDPGSAAQGGDLGWQPPGTFTPRFQEVLDELKPGEMSEPFETEFGIHLAQLLDRRETDFTERVEQNRAYQAIKRRKTEEYFPIWLQQQRDEAFIDIRLGK